MATPPCSQRGYPSTSAPSLLEPPANDRVEPQLTALLPPLGLARTPAHDGPATPRPTPADTSITEPLGQLVNRIHSVVGGMDKTTKLFPYADIARLVICSASESVWGQVGRVAALRKLVVSLNNLYSCLDEGVIGDLEDVMVRATVQTIECAIFIQQFMTDTGSRTVAETEATVSRISKALEGLEGELRTTGRTTPTPFASAQTLQVANRQVGTTSLIALLEPVSMGVESRETCLPGTRMHILQDLFTFLTSPNPSKRVIWLRGPAGSGKSTILNTIARYCSNLRRCGAFLFWDRNDPKNSDPLRVIRTLAYELAQSNPAFRDELTRWIQSSPQTTKYALEEQFQSLLQYPLATIAGIHDWGPIIIILDALDECGTPETRKSLLKVLSTGLATLPPMFRFLVASRAERDICVAFSNAGVAIRDILIDDESTASDVSQFFQQRLSGNAPAFAARGLPPDWPGDPVRQQLVEQSGGLFIWASTTVRFIESGFPNDRLTDVLEPSPRSWSHDNLDDLYQAALTRPFDSCNANELGVVHSILGAIVVAREQLTVEHLSRLLNLELGTVQEVLSRMQPLLQGGHGKPVRVLHASFTDFLCDPRRCEAVQWYIDASAHHCNLVSGCLQLMRQNLKFNICDIETSYCRHMDIEGIQERIDEVITPVLIYASQYWADHLELGSSAESSSRQLAGDVMDFMTKTFLHWIEVFSLKNQMCMIPVILRKAAGWAKKYNLELQEIISEAKNFINAFAYPISHSLPHIYLSALPFSPSKSTTPWCIRDAYRNTLSVELGESSRWPMVGQTLMARSGSVLSVAFSPDNTRIASSSDNAIRVWDAVSGTPVDDPLIGHSDCVRSVSFSPDGARLVSGSDDGTIRTWDLVSGTPTSEPLRGHSSSVLSVAFSPDGARIISGSGDQTIRIWDAASGKPIGEPFRGHSGQVRSVAFSPDGAHIISGSDDSTVRIWEAASGTPIGEPLLGHSGSVHSVAYSPAGSSIASASADGTIQIWDARSATPIGGPLRGHGAHVNSVMFSCDGTRIVSGSQDGTVRMWDTDLGVLMGTPLRGHSLRVSSVALSPDGTHIASGSGDHTVRMWDAASCSPIREPSHLHSDSVMSVTFSSDGTLLVSGSIDKTVRMWDAASGAPNHERRPLEGHSRGVLSVAISPNGTRIVSGSGDTTVRIWDAVSGAETVEPLQGHSDCVRSVSFSPDATRVVSGSDDETIRIWDAVSGAPIGEPIKGHTSRVLTVAFSPCGNWILSGSGDNTIRIWNAASGAPIGEPLEGHSDRVRSIAFAPDGTRMASGSSDNTIRIWRVVPATGTLTPIGEPLLGHSGSVLSVAYSHDGTRIVSGSADRTVRIWDATSGGLIGDPLRGHCHNVVSVAISPDGTHIASASFDSTIRVWDVPPAAVTISQGCHSGVISDDARPFCNVDVIENAPVFSSGRVLREDGWMTTADGLLLFWVPPEYQSRLVWPQTHAVIGAQPIQINFERFVHGSQWGRCYTGNRSRATSISPIDNWQPQTTVPTPVMSRCGRGGVRAVARLVVLSSGLALVGCCLWRATSARDSLAS